ncbi:MAG: redoxin family protein [Dehalococcoidales bacterium]|nr:redoxin family protein [Dehalococcoidales bacterium]
MGKKMITILPIIIVVLVLVSGCGPQPASPTVSPNATTPVAVEGVNVGNRAIDFQLQSLDGKTVKLSDFRGKPVLLNFWATWCGPCRSEMPYLQQISDNSTATGLVMLAVDAGENATVVQKFMTELNLTIPVLLDTDKTVSKSYSITAIPSTFLIDKNGVIQKKILGAFPDKQAIENSLKTIIP